MKEIPQSPVLILGYGREGQSVHNYLNLHHPKISLGIADQQDVSSVVNTNVNLHSGKEYLQSVFDYNVIIRSPGIPTNLPELQRARNQGKWVTSATNIFFSECPGVVIGVTGTKGKSTTTSLIAEIVRKKNEDVRLVGNIGLPALDYLDGADENTIFVMELSSHQLEDCHYSPHIAVVLDIVPEHLDYYKNFAQYAKAKGRIIANQTGDDIVIFNPNHPEVVKLVEQTQSQKMSFSSTYGPNFFCWIENGIVYTKGKAGKKEEILSTKSIPLLGKGNIENSLAAITAGLVLNVPIDKIQRAIYEFKPLEHRLEFVGEFRGIKFYNDSLATIPEAAIHALEALGPDVSTLIAGGYDRGLNYSSLGKIIVRSSVQNLVLFPDTGSKIADAVKTANPNSQINIIPVTRMKEAVNLAYELTAPGKICVMSPAAASFNLFKDYAERGRAFKECIQKLSISIVL